MLVQETQLGSLPLQRFLNLTTSFPQKMHRFAASSRLDYLLNPFLILIAHQSNCTQAFFFRRWICSSHLCVMPDRKPEKGLEKNAECTRCVCARATFLGLQRFGTPSQPGKHRYGSLQNCSPHFASQQPGSQLALTQMPAHTLTPKKRIWRQSSTRTPYLQPFSPHPAHRAVTLRGQATISNWSEES